MALAADRFLERLERDALAPAYFLYGDEPLQLSECTDALRRAARAAGLSERLVFDADSASDWERIRGESSAMSLFAERRLIEVRIGSRKPDKGGQAVIGDILAGGSDDVFLFTSGALDGRQRKAQWFKLLEKGTVCVATRDLPAAQLPGWLSRRAARFDKRLSGDAAELIAERVEGNLLAAAQEVEKLCLLVDADAIDARSVIAAVSDSARYDVYQLVDAALLGDSARALRVARGLREEGVEPVLVAWALGRELHQLAAIAAAAARGGGITRAMDEHRVWSNRKRMVGKMLERHGAQALLGLMAAANSLDTVVKGAQFGAPWDEIEILVLRMCGVAGAARLAGSYH